MMGHSDGVTAPRGDDAEFAKALQELERLKKESWQHGEEINELREHLIKVELFLGVQYKQTPQGDQ
jgi:hypothetical protein